MKKYTITEEQLKGLVDHVINRGCAIGLAKAMNILENNKFHKIDADEEALQIVEEYKIILK